MILLLGFVIDQYKIVLSVYKITVNKIVNNQPCDKQNSFSLGCHGSYIHCTINNYHELAFFMLTMMLMGVYKFCVVLISTSPSLALLIHSKQRNLGFK